METKREWTAPDVHALRSAASAESGKYPGGFEVQTDFGGCFVSSGPI